MRFVSKHGRVEAPVVMTCAHLLARPSQWRCVNHYHRRYAGASQGRGAETRDEFRDFTTQCAAIFDFGSDNIKLKLA